MSEANGSSLVVLLTLLDQIEELLKDVRQAIVHQEKDEDAPHG